MRPKVTTTAVEDWSLRIWEMPSCPGGVSEDDYLVEALSGNRLRLAVLDGVTPAPDTPCLAGLNGATAAAGMLRTALRAGDDVIRTAEQVGALLRHPGLSNRSQPQTCGVVCDLPARGASDGVTVIRFGDCEAWARVEARWSPVLTGNCRTAHAVALLKAWRVEHHHFAIDEVIAADARLNAGPEWFITPPVGRFSEVRPQSAELVDADEVVLASDGARLNPERLDRIDEWLSELRAWERSTASPGLHAKPHDDVTVIRARRCAGRR